MERFLENYFFLSILLGIVFFFAYLLSLILDFSKPENRLVSGLISLIPSYLIIRKIRNDGEN